MLSNGGIPDEKRYDDPWRECDQYLLPELAQALQGGITFAPVGVEGNAMDVDVTQAYTGKCTRYRLTLGSHFFYPRSGKQPTKAQAALIDPVLRTVSLYNVPMDRLAYLANPGVIAANAPPPEPPAPRAAKAGAGPKRPWWYVAGLAFAPVYAIGSLLFKTASKYK